jgi:serine/threonine protein kinase
MESLFKTKLEKAFLDINAQVILDKDITFQNEIARGGFGIVYKGIYNGLDVAIKEMISFDFIDEEDGKKLIEDMTDIINEIKVMLFANNEKFPKFHGVVITDKINLVFELIKGETLSKVHESKCLTRRDKLDIISQLCERLSNLSDKKVIHRDIKPQNIMIEEGNKLRLIDFGIARISTKTSHFTNSKTMTANYMPPEVLDIQILDLTDSKPFKITPKLDVWSCGCILSELFSGVTPWSNKCKNTLAITRALIRKEKFPIPDNIDEDVKEIVRKACEIETENRLSAKEMKKLVDDLLAKN